MERSLPCSGGGDAERGELESHHSRLTRLAVRRQFIGIDPSSAPFVLSVDVEAYQLHVFRSL